MSNGATPQLRGPHLAPEDVLLRLVWDSDDIDPKTREISTSSFAKRDLMSVENGLSVDNERLAIRAVILHLAQKQKAKAEGNESLNRTEALLAKAVTGDICEQIFDEDQQKMFAVISTPISADDDNPENPAHAEILNISGRTKKSALNKVRLKLQPLFSIPERIDDVIE
ncbi:MAG: hypothetical protein ABGX47_23625 [Martelella sp.]|uniref:hypothetical protein n=1 Tax=Martelella sp. TaxID=1969699 RepID=UPI003241CF3F